MLALTVFMLIVAEMIPASSETIPMLGIFFTCVMIQMVLMVFAMCYSLNLHFKDPTPDNQIGKWTRMIVYNCLAYRLGLRKKAKKQVHNHRKMNGNVNGYANGHAGHDISDLEDIARNGNTMSLKKNTTIRNGTGNSSTTSEDSVTAMLMRKKLEMEEEKMRDEESELSLIHISEPTDRG